MDKGGGMIHFKHQNQGILSVTEKTAEDELSSFEIESYHPVIGNTGVL